MQSGSDEERGLARAPRDRPPWASGIHVPGWLDLREGGSPLVVVAPHGGRRRRAVRRGDGVNDLHTAGIALELARRLDARAIVNHGLDRNDIDLNRISHLTDRAPEVLDLLAAAVESASSGGHVPLVLFVHGWNMVTATCDLGVGLRRRDGVLTGVHPTLARDRYEGDLASVEAALAARGLGVGIGLRYAASGKDNAAQLFSGRHAGHAHPVVDRLSRAALEGRVDAAQLELGIPLRWPGSWREAFLDAMEEALGARGVAASGAATPAARRDGASVAASTREVPAGAPRGWTRVPSEKDAFEARGASVSTPSAGSLQAVLDVHGETALFCGIDASAGGAVSHRFALVRTDGTMFLLVAEGTRPATPAGGGFRHALDGFSWEERDDGSRVVLEVHAPMVRYASHDAWMDLEAGLAGADLVQGSANLVYEAKGEGHGRLRGRLRAGELELEVDAVAFHERRSGRGGLRDATGGDRLRILVGEPSPMVLRSRLAASPGAASSSGSRNEAGRDAAPAAGVIATGEDAVSLEIHPGEGGFHVIRPAPGSVHAGTFDEARVVANVPVWRPAGEGVFVRWTFGIARCRIGGRDGVPALYDRLEVFRLPR